MIEELDPSSGADKTIPTGESVAGSRRAAGDDASLNVLCLPARDEADELAGLMFAQVLQQNGHCARCVSFTALAGEMLDFVQRERSQVICVSALPPSAVTHARYLCKRLRARFEGQSVMVGLWTLVGDPRRVLQRVTQDERTHAVVTLAEGLALVTRLAGAGAPNPAAERVAAAPKPQSDQVATLRRVS